MSKLKTEDNFQNLKNFVGEELKAVDDLIMQHANSHVEAIPEVTRYITEAGGKRLRPILTLYWSKIFDSKCNDSILLATAVEFIHTATLLHDDVLDGSPKRRNKPTANIVWDNKLCILVGDYLFSQAFKLMVETGNIKALSLLSNASATIAESEVMQLDLVGNINIDTQQYFTLIEGKTAVLFAASCSSGAMVSKCDSKDTDIAYQYGLNLGMSFQIIDDILDYTASDKFGKKLGNDFLEGKVTLPVILALQNASKNEKKEMINIFCFSEKRENDFKVFRDFVIKNNGIEESVKVAQDFANKAKFSIEDANITVEAKKMLIELSQTQLKRVS